jgi:hypothetical protein
MADALWREKIVDDKLLEAGPSHGNNDFRTFTYLEFQNTGRLHNVSVLSDLESRLQKSINLDNCIVYLISGTNISDGQTSNLLVAIGGPDGVTYAADLDRIGIDAEIKKSRKALKSGIAHKYLGLFIGVIGVPLIIAMVGGVMVVVGISMWRDGERIRRAEASKVELLELHKNLVANLPGIRWL